MGKVFLFFFSSRRRHTRCSRDWSSDVCSSDLTRSMSIAISADGPWAAWESARYFPAGRLLHVPDRSEERRVGKECRCRWSPHLQQEKRTQHGSAWCACIWQMCVALSVSHLCSL